MDQADFAPLEAEIARLAAPRVPSTGAMAGLKAASRVLDLAKGRTLYREGDPVTALYFVLSGIMRYYTLAEGIEHTGQFFDAGMFLGDVAGLTDGGASLHTVDAVQTSRLIVVPRPALLADYDADHALERFARRGMEEAMAGSQRRTANLLRLSPEDNYARLVKTRPEVARQTPLYMIASYLGVTPEALSRIRRRRTTG